MTVLRFDPFREFDRLTDPGRTRARVGGLPMDAVRRDDELVLQFDLPGVDPESVEVTVEKGLLTVSAERHPDRREGDELVVTERPAGRFMRRLQLGEGLDVDRVRATSDAGVLTVAFPMAEEVRPRRITVQAAAPVVAVAEAPGDTAAA